MICNWWYTEEMLNLVTTALEIVYISNHKGFPQISAYRQYAHPLDNRHPFLS